MGLWSELIERDTGTTTKKKKKLHEGEKIENTEFMGELLSRKEGGDERKQSIPIYKVGSPAN